MEETIKILLVDDDQVDRMAVRRALMSAGLQMELSEVSDCAGAIAALQQQQFDCAFLDYMLPDGDGLTLVQQIRSLEITTPLVVLTGQGDEQIAVQVMKAGASDYISKARLSPQGLYQVTLQTINLHRAEKAAALANQKLRESEERYRLVLEAANDGIWDWYCATNEIYCNERLLEILGVSHSEFSFTPAAFAQLIHSEDLPRIRQVIAAHLQHGEKCEAEFRLYHASGEYRHCIARGKAQHDRFGCPIRISGIITDITERKKLEHALRASESRFKRLGESNIIGIVWADFQGNILDANNAFLQIVRYNRQDLISKRLRWREMTPPQYAPQDQQAIEQLLTVGVFSPFEKEYIRSDGSRVPILLGGALVEGSKETAICFVIDLSERKRSEAEIVKLNRDLERRVIELETLLDVIPIGIAIAQDPECHHIRTNPSLAKLLNLSVANASVGDPLAELVSYKFYKDGKQLAVNQLPMQYAAKEGVEVINDELDVVIPAGAVVKLLANAVPLFDEQGKCRGSIGAFLDITERKQIEERERFLAEASVILATSLDYQTILENLARLVVSQVADWCWIHVVEENGSLSLVTVTHPEPLKQKWGEQLLRRYPVDPNATFGTAKVISSGQTEFYSQITDTFLVSMARDHQHLETLRLMGLKSFMCVPMKARGRTLGSISFVSAESDRIYTPDDLALVEDLGHRAGLAVDNARLYREATEIGENLRQAIIILGEQQQQLRVLQRITNLLNQRLTNLPGLLQVMVGAVRDGIPEADFAAIVLYNTQTNQLEVTATVGDLARLEFSELFNIGQGLLNQVFLTGESRLFQASNLPNSPEPTPASIYATAIASVQSGRLGVLAIGNCNNPHAFDVEDRNLLAAVGEQAAIAINNARLISALEEREERLAMQNELLAQQNRDLEISRLQIERQNLQLIEAARLKSQFLATMSHELRTPMNAIMGFAQVLLRQRSASLAPNQVDMIQRILNNGQNLLALINDILDLSKIEAGRLELKLEECNLSVLTMATIAELRSLAEHKQLPLKVDITLQNPLIVNDSVRLRQVLVNLLSNAIKFTETGCIEVKVSEISPSQIAISVKDTGIGIAESELKHIFEEFRQVDQTITRKHGGTGLGLAITNSLVNMMEGTISVESQLGKGSTFYVQLPRQLSRARL